MMTQAPQRPVVVVGVEERAGARAAITVAAQEARCRDATLVAVLAYSTNPALGAPAARPMATMHTLGDERLAAESALRDAVVDALGEEAEQVTLRAVPGMAGRTLVDTAREFSAQLIVLASHGAVSMLPGGVSQYVLRRTPCPVLVVPESSVTSSTR
jgi:nucleotide-binding universal stress UspA family protein